jgi:hypothetical protein
MNTVRLNGRFNGRPLGPGIYSIVGVAQRGTKRTTIGRISIQVVPPGRSLRRAPGSPPKFRCVPALTASGGWGAGLSALMAIKPGEAPVRSGAKLPPRRSGVLAAPPFQLFHHPGRPLWAVILLLLLYTAIALGGIVLAVHLVRISRDTLRP